MLPKGLSKKTLMIQKPQDHEAETPMKSYGKCTLLAIVKKKAIKRVLRIALLLGTVASLFLVPWVLVRAWIRPLPDTVQAQVDQALDYGYAGVIVYVDEAGQAPAFYTAGWHDREGRIPAKPDALFKIGSISKLYTAVAITKLVHRGHLGLDQTVADLFPELAGRIENAERITVRMLVQHRSGIPNYTDTPDYWASPKESNAEKLALVLDRPATFDPGEGYAYSNTNYLLLAMLIEKTQGQSVFKFIQEEILTPLGLQHTFGSVSDVDPADVMSGYHQGHPYDLKADDQGMLATARDVGTFLRALNDGSVFDEGEREIYSTLYKYEHDGWVPGYQSFAKYHEELDAVTVAFYSTTDPDLYLWNLSQILNGRILKLLERQQG